MISNVSSSMNDEGKNRGIATDNPYYGTFQGVANYYPTAAPPAPYGGPHAYYQGQGYVAVPVYAVAEGRPLREHRLPCCGLGLGWLLFIIGFFLGGVPWYIGTFFLLCVRMDYREKPGLIACTVASLIAVVALTAGVTRQDLVKLT
ncbi:large ribosomal subunit protein eL20z-like [Gastrolobium bilobum]|uniref:large ribosomal subunit protein eL20z-like n=1 Tax=Gastrolobium bilobum TaxID=150636 RepID=UPI002AB02A30|nr:large ribosomal subunit protein eL20z-like [Gastrolobium bilobum]